MDGGRRRLLRGAALMPLAVGAVTAATAATADVPDLPEAPAGRSPAQLAGDED